MHTSKIGDLLTKGHKFSRNRLIHWLEREDGLRRHHCPRKGDCIAKRLTPNKTTYISYEEIADNYEEIWAAIPETFRRKATGPVEELGDAISTPPPTPPATPPGSPGERSIEGSERGSDDEEEGEEDAEEDEGRKKTT